jgi:hypothetical protein
VRRQQHRYDTLTLGDASVNHALDDILNPVHEIAERFNPDTHRGTLEVVRDAKELLKGLTRLSGAKGNRSGLEGVKRFGRVIDETFNKLSVYFYVYTHGSRSIPLWGSKHTASIFSSN